MCSAFSLRAAPPPRRLQSDSRRYRLFFETKPGDLLTGDKVALNVTPATPELRAYGLAASLIQDSFDNATFLVSGTRVLERAGGKDFPTTNATVDISSITWLTTICGKSTPFDNATFHGLWLNEFNPAGRNATTMENYYNECSYGKVGCGVCGAPVRVLCTCPCSVPACGPSSVGVGLACACSSVCQQCHVRHNSNHTSPHTELTLNHTPSTFPPQLRFSSATNIVVDARGFDLGCSGTWNGITWDANNCDAQEIYGWMAALEAYTTNVLRIDLGKYTRRVAALPANNCPWAGLASVGCGAYCYTWLQGAYAGELDSAFHELGHNLGLQHSTTPGNEYGDGSCPMGGCCNNRCFNAPQAWRANLIRPVADFNASSLGPGRRWVAVLPAPRVNDTNFVRVRVWCACDHAMGVRLWCEHGL